MKKFPLKQGYVIAPKNYVVLDYIPSKKCLYAGVVTSKNAAKYGIPTFLFFCNEKHNSEYSPEMRAAIFEECRKVFPDFDKYLTMQTTLSVEQMKDPFTVQAWDSLPAIDLFPLIEEGDPLFWNSANPDFVPPDGIMICRKKRKN